MHCRPVYKGGDLKNVVIEDICGTFMCANYLRFGS